jgi:hypothetical protein
MLHSHANDVVVRRNWQLRWETFLPKRKAWMQTLILLPFGLPVGNFLGASWQFSIDQIVEHQQYPIGVLSMVFNLLLPSVFFAVLFHWCWFAWRVPGARWYPQTPALLAGSYATLTIAGSFGVLWLFTSSLGVCGDDGWGEIGQSLLCNLDGYGFESKSWFGVWFIIAAYCYQLRDSLVTKTNALQQKLLRRRYGSIDADSIATVDEAHPHADYDVTDSSDDPQSPNA